MPISDTTSARTNALQSGTFVAPGVAVPAAPKRPEQLLCQQWEYNTNDDLYGMLRFEIYITPAITAFAKVGGRRSNNSGIFAFPTIQNAQVNTLSTFQRLLRRLGGVAVRRDRRPGPPL